MARASSLADPRYAKFRKRLITARKRAGLRQIDVARRLGKPQSYIAKIEAGDRGVDAIEVPTFARIYRVPVTFFYRGLSA